MTVTCSGGSDVVFHPGLPTPTGGSAPHLAHRLEREEAERTL